MQPWLLKKLVPPSPTKKYDSEDRKAERQRERAARQVLRIQNKIQQRKGYNEYLKSEKWQQLRHKIFRRCHGVCEGCGDRPAVEVHHLTYERFGDELLFDLVGVCEECHEKVHWIEITAADRFLEEGLVP